MFITTIMFFMWQTTGDSKYQGPFTRAAEATYSNSEVKEYATQASSFIKSKAPPVAIMAPAAYSLGVRRQVNLVSSKITLVPSSTTTYHYDIVTKAAFINVVFNF